MLLRQVQQIEYVYSLDVDGHEGGKPGKSGKGKPKLAGYAEEIAAQAEAFSGLTRDKGTIMCAPALLEHAARELERDSGVLKQIRKPREERTARVKSRGSGKKDE